VFAVFPHRWQGKSSLTPLLFAAPMVGASPDNIGAQRLAEGGAPTSGAGLRTKSAHEAKGQPK